MHHGPFEDCSLKATAWLAPKLCTSQDEGLCLIAAVAAGIAVCSLRLHQLLLGEQ